MLKKLLTFTFLSLSMGANATLLSLDDWWLQTDGFGGLRQSTTDPSVYFAVSQFTTRDISDTYELLTGFHWASAAEAQAIFDSSPENAQDFGCPPKCTYFNRGGWRGYTWEGEWRSHFLFSDSAATNLVMHTGAWEDLPWTVYANQQTRDFAGLVLISDATVVPMPATAWLIGSALLGLGIVQRKKA